MAIQSEKPTDDVYQVLKNTNSTNELTKYINDIGTTYTDMSFASHFSKYLDKFCGNRQDLARLSLIDNDYIYQILNGSRKPDREKIIALCLAIGMTDKECTRCLERSHYSSLYAKNQRDSVIIYAFQNKHSVQELNDRLIKLNMQPLQLTRKK